MDTRQGQLDHRGVAAAIRERITAGGAGYRLTDPALPSERKIAETFGVSRPTVGRALAWLADRCVIIPKQKRGYRVSPIQFRVERHVPFRYSDEARERMGAKGAYDAEVRAAGLTPRWTSTTRTGTAPAAVAQILGIAADGRVEITERIMSAAHPDAPDDFVPMQLATSYVPKDIADAASIGTSGTDRGVGGMISRLADAGFVQDGYTEVSEIRDPSDDEARLLSITPNTSVIELMHTAHTAQTDESDPVCTEVTVHVMVGPRWTLKTTWRR